MTANAEMVEGYMDGSDWSSPEPSGNRTRSYRHGFANGRDDLRGNPRASYNLLKKMAEDAMRMDELDGRYE